MYAGKDGVDWDTGIALFFLKKMELKNVETRAFLTVCEIMQ